MAKFSRERAIRGRDFPPLRLNENDLKYITNQIKQLIVQSPVDDRIWHTYFNITIKRADSDEAFRTDDPDFLASDNMPNVIESVSISVSKSLSVLSRGPIENENSFSIRVTFDSGSIYPTNLYIEESGSGHYTLNYNMIDETIRQKESNISSIVSFVHSSLFPIAIWSVIWIMLLWLSYSIATSVPRNPGEVLTVHSFLSYGTIYAVVCGAFIAVITMSIPYVRRRFPYVAFYGKIRDQYSHSRSSFKFIFVVVLIPIIIGLILIAVEIISQSK